MFEPIDKFDNNQPNKYYEKIIESIRGMMLSGQLDRDSKLPSERELAKMFNVSRVPVREAMKILEYLGVVKNIPGDGMYVYNVGITDLIDKLDFALELSEDDIYELFEVRETIETISARLAANRRTGQDIEEMQNSIDKMEKDIANGISVVDSSYEFHHAIIKATKNKVLHKLYDTLNNFMKLSKGVTLGNVKRLNEPLYYHKKILDKIIEQDAEGAMKVMRDHIENAKESFEIFKNEDE